jgi:MraZ protein
MANFLGEFECTLDAKGRFMLPAGLKKQFPKGTKQFVIKRGFEKCLILYPSKEWEAIADKVNRQNDFVKSNRTFKRYYFQGATPLEPDGSSRVLIPKSLQEFAGLKTDIVLFAYASQIEIWSKDEYDKMLKSEPDDFSALAEKVMGGSSEEGTTE